MKRTLLMAILLVVVGTYGQSGWAQVSACPDCGRDIHWVPQRRTFELLAASVTVELPKLPESAEWVIGVRGQEGRPQVMAAEVTFEASHQPRTITNWPQDKTILQPGRVIFGGLNQLTGSFLAYVTVPATTEVTVIVSGRQVMAARVNESAIVRNGELVPGRLRNAAQLLMSLSLTQSATRAGGNAELTQAGPDRYYANGAALRSHLLEFIKPTIPGVNREHHVVALQFAVDETGSVPKAVVLSGDDPFASTCVQAILQWKFQPFSAADKPVRINGMVLFSFGRDGRVRTSLTD